MLAGGFEEGGAELGFAEGGILEKAFGVGLVEGFFFVGEGCGDGAEAVAGAGGAAGH